MFPIDPETRQVLNGPVQAYSIRGTCGDRSFNADHDILAGTFRITNQVCDATEVALGGVYVGQLTLSFSNRFATERGSWLNKPIRIEIGVDVGGDFQWIPAPCGTFHIQDATWTQNGLDIIAYDNMMKFDKAITLNSSSGTAFDFLKFACNSCGVSLGMTRAEVEALPNGSELLGLYPTDSIQTWRDLLRWLAQTLCSFATISRTGELILKPFPTIATSKSAIDVNRRYTGASFSDFDTYYTKIYVTNLEDNSLQAYSLETDDGLAMDLGGNPFLQYGTDETKKAMRLRILNHIAGFRFAPFNCSKLLDPTYDLGDCVEFTGGIARGCSGMVMSYSMDSHTLALSGFGENPALANVVSDAEKAAAGASGNANSKNVNYLTYTNVAGIEFENNVETVLATMKFYVTDESTVTMWLEFIDNIPPLEEFNHLIQFHYYLDGEPLSYAPREELRDGVHIVTLNYYLLNVTPGELHEFTVTALFYNGTHSSRAEDIHFLMMGQGLNEDKGWGGLVEVEDSTVLRFRGRMEIDANATINSLALQTPLSPINSDSVRLSFNTNLELNLEESLEIVSKMDVYELITEDDGVNLLTEEGGLLLTEGDIV